MLSLSIIWINHPNTLRDWRFYANLRNVWARYQFCTWHGLDRKNTEVKEDNFRIQDKNVSEIRCEEEKLETFSRINETNEIKSNLFLVGDSHFGKYAKYLNKFGVGFHGGQIMNGSGFSDGKFSLDPDKIFIPHEDDNLLYLGKNL